MTSQQESYQSMYEEVEYFLNANMPITTTIPNAAVFLTLLHNGILQIHYNASQQDYDITGTAELKEELRINLEGQGLDIALKTVAYAKFANDKELLKKVKEFTRSELKYCADNFLIEHCNDIHDLANANLAALAPYNVTAGMLTNLQNANTAYTGIIAKPKVLIEDRKKFTDKLAELFKQMNAAFDVADAAVEVIRLTQPDFYAEYKRLRKVVNTGARKLSLKGKAIDKVTAEPMEGVTFAFTHEDGLPAGKITKLTAAHGGFIIKNMPTGMYTVKVSMTDYKPQTLTVAVNNVKMTRLVVEMEMLSH